MTCCLDQSLQKDYFIGLFVYWSVLVCSGALTLKGISVHMRDLNAIHSNKYMYVMYSIS